MVGMFGKGSSIVYKAVLNITSYQQPKNGQAKTLYYVEH